VTQHVSSTMTAIKNEVAARGEKGDGITDKKQRRFKKKGRKSKKAKAIDALVTLVERRLKAVPMTVPKKITVWGDQQNFHLFQHMKASNLLVPVTWAIPRQRPANNIADDRFRNSNQVYLTGVRFRMTVHYSKSVRIRLALYKLSSPGERGTDFISTKLGTYPGEPNVSWQMEWYEIEHFLPHGPYHALNYEKSVPISPSWILSSPDGTAFSADLAKNEYKPKATMTYVGQKGFEAAGADTWGEIDWYVPIGERINFLHETEKTVVDHDYRILLSYDCPAFEMAPKTPVLVNPNIVGGTQVKDSRYYKEPFTEPKKDPMVRGVAAARIPFISSTVYYR